jgi:hypothetical protein
MKVNYLNLFKILLIILIGSSPYRVLSQGCSDAGFCTMGAMRPNQHFSTKLNMKLKSVEFGQYIGYTKFGDVILSYIADANFAVNRKTAVQFKLPYTFVSGFLANTNGLGDISISATRNILYRENYQINITAGSKLPTNDANKKSGGRPLPMYYQTSLGTFDVIIGVSLVTKKWLVATGYQQSLNPIDNDFIWGDWKGTEFEQRVREYPVSSMIRRGKDIMFRVERNFRSSRFNAYVGLLPIIRVSKDRVLDPKTQKIVKVNGSEGLALTGLCGFGYRFSFKSSFKFLAGASIIQRDFNPDGLSRRFVNTIGYEYRF